MISKPLAEINFQDLKRLQDNGIQEGRTIEYKRQLDNSDRAKQEFLRDISSFANASGGDLIYGIIEEDGVPCNIVGFKVENIDDEILKRENQIRDGIEPRVSVSIKPIKLENGKIVLIFRIAKSWNFPHRVIYNKDYQFYSRNSEGKYPMDTNELRIAFNLSQSLYEKINNFRKERASLLNSTFGTYDCTILLYRPQVIAFHVIPYGSFRDNNLIDISKISYRELRPLFSEQWDGRITFDGILSYSGYFENKYSSFIQLYRNGIFEVATCLVGSEQDGEKYLAPQKYEAEILACLREILCFYEKHCINPPFVMFLTFINILGYKMPDYGYLKDSYKIDRSDLLIPGKIVETYFVHPNKILKPVFDQVWNACGHPGSANFDQAGKWRPLS